MKTGHKQGIRANWGQFALQLLTVFAVGLTIGAERNVVPILGRDVFDVESLLVIGSFVVSFGFVKALLNLYGGKWAETYGRKPILVAGWLVAPRSRSFSSSHRTGGGSRLETSCLASTRGWRGA